MSRDEWNPVSPEEPCEICEHDDWCTRTCDGAVRCRRVADPPNGWRLVKRFDEGGVFRPVDEEKASVRHNRKKGSPDWDERQKRFLDTLCPENRDELARKLGVGPDALGAIGVGWDARGKVWTFPERDGTGRIIGIATRRDDGSKRCIRDSRRGLTIPDGQADMPDPVLIVEGPSDVAALLTVGVAAVGRPSNRGGISHISQLLRDRRVIVVGEHDPKPNGQWPGHDGAIAVATGLSKAWGRPVKWSMPPDNAKDARAWLQERNVDVGDREACKAAGCDFLAALDKVVVKATAAVGAPTDSSQYEATGQGLIWRKATQSGELPVPLTNFEARIVEDVVQDDGSGEATHVFTMEATLNGRCKRFDVPASRFAGLSWVTENLGAGAVVYAGFAKKDHTRVAIQILSRDVKTRVVYKHLGWRHVDGRWVYLHAGGAIDAHGLVSDIDVSPPADLSKYLLPDPPNGAEAISSVRASLRILDLAPDTLVIPLLAAVWRAVLGPCDSSLHLTGTSGEFKTELAALAQQHFGPGLDARNLPASWCSTGNALETIAFAAKDAVLTIDDFAPSGTANDIARLHKEAARIFRAQGNRSGRQRLRADGTLRASKAPRGLILSTGEDIPSGQSIRARVFIVEVELGAVDTDMLTLCQEDATAGLYAVAMAAYLKWLAQRYGEIHRSLRGDILKLRAEATVSDGMHRRTPDTVANLGLGVRTFLEFAEDIGAIDGAQYRVLWDRCWRALGQVAAAQVTHVVAADPVDRFLELLSSAIAAGGAHLANPDGRAPLGDGSRSAPCAWGWRNTVVPGTSVLREDWRPQGLRVGWIDQDDIYLDLDAAYKAAQAAAGTGADGVSVQPRTLAKRLSERGALKSRDERRNRLTVRRDLEGKRRYVIHLSTDIFQKPTQPAPAAHNPRHTASDRDAGPVSRAGSEKNDGKTTHQSGPQDEENKGRGSVGPVGPVSEARDSEELAEWTA